MKEQKITQEENGRQRKRGTITAFASEAFSMAVHIARSLPWVVQYALQEGEYKQLPESTPLYINCRPYKIHKSMEQGERELVHLANTVSHEGSWLFVPEEQVWYHNTLYHTENYGREGSLKLSAHDLSELSMFDGKEIVHCHIHPRIAGQHAAQYRYECLLDKLMQRNPKFSAQAIRETAQALSTVYQYCFLALPSPDDIAYYAGMQNQMKGRKFHGCIASPLGITSVEVVDPSRETLETYTQVHKELEGIIKAAGFTVKEQKDSVINIEIDQKGLCSLLQKKVSGRIKLEHHYINYDKLSSLVKGGN